MTDADFGTFDRAFGRVAGAFRLKLKKTELDDLSRTYFRVLEIYSLDLVLQAGKACIESCRKWPLAADWLAELSKGPATASCPTDRRQMSVAELDDHSRAEQLRYADEPCLCAECEHAGVMYRALRFVPTVQGDDYEQAFNPRRGKVEIVGHWAHGEELRRWYAARAHFFALKAKSPLRAMPVVAGRQPGEDDDI